MNTQELIGAIAEALPYAADGEWRCDPDTGNIFTTEHLNVGYVHMMPDLTLCVFAKQMANALIASQEREKVLREALEWYVENDDVNEGDEPIENLGGQTWNQYNEYWIDGLNRARQALQSTEQQG